MVVTTAIMCLALNVYYEARSEPINGQIAVANVTMRRAGWDQRNICREVFRPAQFSWTIKYAFKVKGGYGIRLTGLPQDVRAWDIAMRVASAVLHHEVKSLMHGATYYHADYVHPRWAKHLRYVGKIGHHLFYAQR